MGRGEERNQPSEARGIVAQYCRLDYAGARLNPADWTKLQPLVSWRQIPDFPLVNVVSRFDIDPNVAYEHGKLYVTVHYRLLGRFTVGEVYSREVAGSVEDVQFAIADTGGNLKIVSAERNYPHPSRAAMLKWLQENASKSQDPAKNVYEQAFKDLSEQSGSPFGK